MDVRCLHLLHWNFPIIVEQMDPTYAYVPSLQCLQRGEFVYSLHPRLQLCLIFHSLKDNCAKNLLGLENCIGQDRSTKELNPSVHCRNFTL
jgi:hypothetical protein